jgi:hypothetical protein
LHSARKRQLVIGLTAVAVAAFAGGAYAATQSAGADSRQAFLKDVAGRLHVTPQQLTAALDGAAIDQLQAEVAAGRLTQAEANQLEQRLKANGGSLPPFGFGLGLRGLVAPPMMLRPGPFPAGPGALKAAATYLGLSDLDLFRQLAGGKSLAQIAASTGKSVGGLEQAMTAAVKAKLDKLVAAKVITQTQEQQELSQFSAQVNQEVNQKGLEFKPHGSPLPRLRFPLGAPDVPAPPASVAPPDWSGAPSA